LHERTFIFFHPTLSFHHMAESWNELTSERKINAPAFYQCKMQLSSIREVLLYICTGNGKRDVNCATWPIFPFSRTFIFRNSIPEISAYETIGLEILRLNTNKETCAPWNSRYVNGFHHAYCKKSQFIPLTHTPGLVAMHLHLVYLCSEIV